MRLLNTNTLQLSCFVESQVRPYAVLSHTWGGEEVLFNDIMKEQPVGSLALGNLGDAVRKWPLMASNGSRLTHVALTSQAVLSCQRLIPCIGGIKLLSSAMYISKTYPLWKAKPSLNCYHLGTLQKVGGLREAGRYKSLLLHLYWSFTVRNGLRLRLKQACQIRFRQPQVFLSQSYVAKILRLARLLIGYHGHQKDRQPGRRISRILAWDI